MSNELELKKQNSEVVEVANGIWVSDSASYDNAMAFLQKVKEVKNNVVSYWKPKKDSAYATWKLLTASEKEFLEPLNEAESTVKGKMKNWSDSEERRASEESAKLAELRRIESEKMLQQAVEKEEKGDIVGSKIFADIAEKLESNQTFTPQTAKKGVRKVKKFVVVDDSQVPIYLGDVCFRPVDINQVEAYYSLTGKLPKGIEIQTETIISVR